MPAINEFSIGGQASAAGLVAKASGTQANGTPITTSISSFGTVATGGDSAVLPIAVQGAVYLVENIGAASMQVYGSATSLDTINGVATATGVAVANAKRALFFVTVPAVFTPGLAGAAGSWSVGKWAMILTA